jgi:superfamily II DNA or RNA helicase
MEYIYVRTNEWWDMYDICKIGKSINIPNRENGYVPGEPIRGKFIHVFKVHQMDVIETLLKEEFHHLNFNQKNDEDRSGGTEFFDKSIINLIEPFLIRHEFTYIKLTGQEINELERGPSSYRPRDYQTTIIEKSIEYFKTHAKGLLVLMCGVGKTLISLWIAQALKSRSILIGVPNVLLLEQWKNAISTIFKYPCLVVSDGVSVETIQSFLAEQCIVITTYSSAHKVFSASKTFKFDMKIQDECHHLTSIDIVKDSKQFVQMLNIESEKQLSLTATLKTGEYISNDNVDYFGDIIDRKCLLWAIDQRIVCDYSIQTIVTNEAELNDETRFALIEDKEKRLFLSAFASLKSINDGHSHHILIYANTKFHLLKIMYYIDLLLKQKYFTFPVYYSDYHGEKSTKEQDDSLKKFETSKFGILACVYCLGEGWDFPLLDAVVFAENMSSNIRIVQSALRASRKNKKDPSKKTKIILPILNRNDWLENNDNLDLKKVREVIYQMGLEDETVTQKMSVIKIKVERHRIETEPVEFGVYDDAMTQHLRLKSVHRSALSISYEKARTILYDKDIKSIESYHALCDKDFRLHKEPDVVFKGQFTNWLDYLSINRDDYYNVETCKEKVRDYIKLHPSLKDKYLELSVLCAELCKLDVLFPPPGLWRDCYGIELHHIIAISYKKKSKGCI